MSIKLELHFSDIPICLQSIPLCYNNNNNNPKVIKIVPSESFNILIPKPFVQGII